MMIYFAKATQAWPVTGKASGAKLELPEASHSGNNQLSSKGAKGPSQATGHQFLK